MLRDQIIMYQDKFLMRLECEGCGEIDHSLRRCPNLSYIPKRDFVLRKYLYNENQRRKKSKRKTMKKSQNALLFNFEIRYSDRTYTSDNSPEETIRDGTASAGPSRITLENEDEIDNFQQEPASLPVRRKENRRNLFMKFSREPLNNLVEGEDPESQDNNNNQLPIVSSFGKDDSRLISLKTNSFITAGTALDFNQHNRNIHQSFNNQGTFPLIFGGLITEKMNHFKYYFPYNNCKTILTYFKRDLQFKSQSPTRQKKNIETSSHFYKKNNSGIAKNGIYSLGLIYFRNMQKFFMKTKPDQPSYLASQYGGKNSIN
jgi:hypothetical protein